MLEKLQFFLRPLFTLFVVRFSRMSSPGLRVGYFPRKFYTPASSVWCRETASFFFVFFFSTCPTQTTPWFPGGVGLPLCYFRHKNLSLRGLPFPPPPLWFFLFETTAGLAGLHNDWDPVPRVTPFFLCFTALPPCFVVSGPVPKLAPCFPKNQ